MVTTEMTNLTYHFLIHNPWGVVEKIVVFFPGFGDLNQIEGVRCGGLPKNQCRSSSLEIRRWHCFYTTAEECMEYDAYQHSKAND